MICLSFEQIVGAVRRAPFVSELRLDQRTSDIKMILIRTSRGESVSFLMKAANDEVLISLDKDDK